MNRMEELTLGTIAIANSCCLCWDTSTSSSSHPITYHRLKECINRAFQNHHMNYRQSIQSINSNSSNLHSERWLVGSTREYLNKAAFSGPYVDMFMGSTYPTAVEYYLPIWKLISNVYQPLPLTFMDAPMHLLSLGIGKTLYDIVYDYSNKSIVEKSRRYIMNVVNSIKKLKLRWFIMTPFESSPGMLSESFIAYIRIFKVIGYMLIEYEHEYYSSSIKISDNL